MHIAALYTYPIKSLPPLPLTTTPLTAHGLQHDRRFLLQRTDRTPPEILMIGREPQIATFTLTLPTASTLHIQHRPTGRTLTLPLTPSPDDLTPAELTMHNSPATGAMELTTASVAEFFSGCLGFPVRMLYLPPDGSRPILGSVRPQSAQAGRTIGFSDCAPVMVATLPSLRAVPCDDADMVRFRPNVVVEADAGDLGAWEEDFWGVVRVGDVEVEMTANCVRCRSLDVDFEGGWLRGEERRLSRLMKERRVDRGAKYSPVFGRYGVVRGEGGEIAVGDTVAVVERVEERTVLRWPGIGTGWKEMEEEEAAKKRAEKEAREGLGFLERTRTATSEALERTRSMGEHGVKEGFDEAGSNCVVC